MDTTKNAYKVAQAIKKHGTHFTASRDRKDEFGCVTDQPQIILENRGLFHTDSGFLHLLVKESGLVSGKRAPMLLILYTDVLQKGDSLALGGKEYTVAATDDAGGLGILLDLSLEARDV